MEREHFPFFFAATLFLFAAVLLTSHPFTGTADGGYAAIFYSQNGANALSKMKKPTPPVISSISPSKATYGDVVNVIGRNFGQDPIVAIDATLSVLPKTKSETSITFVIPAGLSVGVHKIQIGPAKDASTVLSNAITLTVIPTRITFVSDGNETYYSNLKAENTPAAEQAGTAVKIARYKSWGSIAGSSWISYDAKTSATGGGPVNGTTFTFTERINLPRAVTSARVIVLADDSAGISVNGTPVIAGNVTGPFTQCASKGVTCTKPTTVTIPAELFKIGNNEIDFIVNQKKAGDKDDKTPFGLSFNGLIELVPPIATAQCSDGLDNDGDGRVDFPTDLGCQSADDTSEFDATSGTPGQGECLMGKNETFRNPTYAAGAVQAKIASFRICAFNQGIELNSLKFDKDNNPSVKLRNINVMIGSTKVGSTQATVNDAESLLSFDIPVAPINVANGASVVVDVYADIDGASVPSTNASVIDFIEWSAIGLSSNSKLEFKGGPFDGQDVTITTPSSSGDQLTQCNDHFDNDADGRIDYPADPGCASATDNSEL